LVFASHVPKRPLREFIHNFWCYEGYASPYPNERIFPDGTFKLVFNLHDDEFRIYDSRQTAKFRTFSGAMVSRPSGVAFVTDSTEESSVLGVNFRLGGALPFLGFASAEPGGSHLDLRDVCGSRATELHGRLSECARITDRFRILEEWLVGQLTRRERHHREVLVALEMLGRPQPGSRTREIAREVGLSERRFIELFKAEVAIRPKLFSRIRRFQHATSLIGRNAARVDWAVIAADCGYCDQSHLIRDFEIFAGLTPVEYLNRYRHLAQQGVRAKPNHLPLAEHGQFSPIHMPAM
jgi:AraC-like DNA-binding protein